MRKTYTSTFLLGSRSDTDDADGTVTEVMVAQPPSLAEIESALSRFVGEIDQVPPAYSAAKVTGQRAYDLARRGEEVDLKARRVSIDRIEVRQFAWPRLEVEVHCGKGTYIRSLARDLGEVLGCGGLVEVLRRSQVGPFEAAHAVSWDADRDTVRANLKSIFEALSELPCIEVVPELATRLRQGQSLKWQEPWPGDEAVVVETDGSLVAVVRLDRQARCLRPEKVIAF
jgi:tRNA pseudouridine55 synthase